MSPRRLERDINVADSLGLVNPERLRAALDGYARQPGVAPLRELLDRHTFTLTHSELKQARDLVREQTHKAAGLEPLRFTHWQVAYDRPWVQRTLRRVAARLANVA